MKKELKINKMKEVINQLQAQHEKITKVKVAELTGYHRNFITDNWNTILDEKENVQIESVQIPKSVQKLNPLTLKSVQKNDSPEIVSNKKTVPVSDAFRHFLKRR